MAGAKKTRDNLVVARIYEWDKQAKKPKDGGVSIQCMFNPFEYTVSKTNSYEEQARNKADVPSFEFKKGGPQTLKLSLTFDTYEKEGDVSLETNRLWKLMEAKTRKEGSRSRKIPPPEVAFEWGVFCFVAVITDMTQKFTLFKLDGTPVRAKVDVTFTQHLDVNDYPKQNPTSGDGELQRMRQVIAGDRLDTIAYEVYGDATKWKKIAERNGILNPLALQPGIQLVIPMD